MDILFWLILIFVVFLFGSRMLPAKDVQNISTQELKNLIKDKDKQFIDVRTSGEYQQHHIKAFQNIPLQQLREGKNKLDPTKETIVICQSGMRSLRAAKLLKKAGFQKIINVKNGMNTWH